MSRRDQIRMTDDEMQAFLAEHRTTQVATINPDGTPHLVAMWYGLIDGEIAMWTYAKSQKARNLRRSPIIGCLVEAGQHYQDLRGVSITGQAQLSGDTDYVVRVGRVVMFPPGHDFESDPTSQQILSQSAAKRVAVTVKPTRVVSWDHRKLGGQY